MTVNDAAPPASPPENAPPAPRGRWRRRILLAAAALALLLGLGAALLPAILSSGWVRARVEGAASEAAGRHIAFSALSVGWGEAGATDLVIRYGPGASDPVLLRVGEVSAPAGITAAFASRYDVETIRVLRPEVRLDLRELAKPAPAGPPAAAPAAAPAGEGAAPLPSFRVKVEVREGTLVQVGLDGKETALGTFEADLAASDDGPATAVLRFDLGPRGKFRVESTASPFKGGRPVDGKGLEGTLAVALEALDLSTFREAAAALGGVDLDPIEGTVSGTASVRLLGGSLEDGKVALALRGLAAGGGGRRVAEETLDLDAGFRRGADGMVEVKGLHVGARNLDLRGSLAMDPAGGPVNGTLEATAEIKDLLDRAKALGVESLGAAVGTLTVEARATGDAAAQRWGGTLRVRDLQVSPGPGKAPVGEPSVTAEFDVVQKGSNFRIDAGTVRSGSLRLEAKGNWSRDEASDLTVAVEAQLAGLTAMAKGFGAPLPGEIAGDASVEARLRRAAPGTKGAGDEARGTVVITGLSVTPPGEGALTVREERFEIAFDAVPGEKEVELRSLNVKGAGLDLSAAGRFDLDGGKGRLTTLESRIDLPRAEALARAFGTEVPVEAAGRAAWKGPVSWRDRFASVDAGPGELVVTDLVATLPAEGEAPARTLREPEVRIALDAGITRTDEGVAVALRSGSVRGNGLEAALAGTVAADRTLDLRASGTAGLAAATARLLALGYLGKDPGPRGDLAFDLTVRGKPDAAEATVTRLELEGAEADLRVTGTASAAGPVDLVVEGGGGMAALLDLAARAGFGEAAPEAAGRATLRLRASTPGKGSPVQVTAEAAVEDLSWPTPGRRRPWTQKRVAVEVDGSLDREKETVLASLTLTTDGGTAVVKGSAGLAEGRRSVEADGDLDIDLGGLTRARPDVIPAFLRPMEVGRAKGKVRVSGPLPSPFSLKGLAGTALLAMDSVKTEAFEMRDASVEALLQGGAVRARSIEATVNGGAVKGEALLVLEGEPQDHFVEVHAAGVEVDRSMAWLLKQVVPIFAVAESGAVTGRLRLDMRLEGSGADWEAVKPNLHGTGALEVADGGLSGSGILVDLLEMLGGAKSMAFKTVSTEFAVHDGKVWNERLLVGGEEHDMVLKGTTSFDGALDYAVGAKFLKMKPKRTERLKPLFDEEGNLPFKLAGSLDRPKVKPPDLEKILGKAAEDALKKKLRELLGGDD